MRKLFLLLALMGMVATGCSKDEVDKGDDNKTEQPNENEEGSEDNIPENIFFALDKESVTISPEGGSVDVVVYSNYKWVISGTSDWCTPSVKGGDANEDGQKVTFSADVAYDVREATFWFRCADKQIKFVVSQKSNNIIIYYTSSNSEIVQPNDSSAFGATIISNIYIDGVGAIEFNAPITSIGDDAFWRCESLTSVTIPDSVTTIGVEAFYDCDSLTSVTIGDSVTTIGRGAFGGCTSLTSVTIPDSVTTIGVAAFKNCRSLTSVTIPDSVTTIGEMAFSFCSSLTSVTIPDSVTTIGEDAFSYCSSLTSVTIPDSVTTIGDEAFYDCDSLTSVTIPNSVTTIGDYTFYDCSSLTSVTIPDSVTTIGERAFWRCKSLTSVTIPDSVTTIGFEAFYGCSSLTSVYCKAITPPAGGSSMFSNNASDRKIYVPMESVNKYKSASYWKNYASDIVGYNF